MPISVVAGCLFLTAWVAGAMILSDHIMGFGTAIQLIYFAITGCLWVLPMTWLMVWASRSR